MKTTEYATNLKCGKCVAAVAPALDAHPKVDAWSVDTSVPEKKLQVTGDLAESDVRSILSNAGFNVLDPGAEATSKPSKLTTYRPLLLIAGYLLGTVLLCEVLAGSFDGMRAMRHFMAGFFLTFSFFKMLDVAAFADSFRSYDMLAAAVPPYAWLYPFIELLLGISYLLNWNPFITNVVTASMMTIGIVGVTRVLLKKSSIQCACLGTVFNLPMSYVTFIENGLMIVMSIAMLISGNS